MKKLIFLLLIVPFIGRGQAIEWHRYGLDSVIHLNEDFEPINFDTTIYPGKYSLDKVIYENGKYINFSTGKDSVCIVFLGSCAGYRVVIRFIKTPTKLIVQDGYIEPAKYEPEEYQFHFGQMDIIMLSIILGILLLVVIFNFKTIFKIKKNV